MHCLHCLLISPRSNVSLWLKYVEMEMRHRFINHARNIWDRAGGQGLHAREVGLLRFVCRLHGWGMGLLCSVCRWWAGELLSATRRRATCVLLGCMAAWNKGAHLAAFNVHLPTVPLLPRIDQLWYKYIHRPSSPCCMPAHLLHLPAVSLLPRIDQLWYKYIHMEEMLGNVAGARQIFERWMQWEPDHHGWMAYIKVRSVSMRSGVEAVS